MPGVRHPQKALASFWMHRDIYTALGIIAKVRGVTMTRLILESLADRFEFTLDEAGTPTGLDLERLAVQAFENRKRTSGKRSSERTSAGHPPSETREEKASGNRGATQEEQSTHET